MDQIVRVIAKDSPVKAMAISARDTVERARAIHDCWPVAAAALGRLLMAASMMGAVMKGEDGAVTAVGDHAGLYETCPAYRRMVELQKLEEEGAKHNA